MSEMPENICSQWSRSIFLPFVKWKRTLPCWSLFLAFVLSGRELPVMSAGHWHYQDTVGSGSSLRYTSLIAAFSAVWRQCSTDMSWHIQVLAGGLVGFLTSLIYIVQYPQLRGPWTHGGHGKLCLYVLDNSCAKEDSCDPTTCQEPLCIL